MTLTTRTLERRQFLRRTLAAAGAAAALPAFQGLGLLGRHGRMLAAPGSGGYGPLVPAPDLRDGVIRIALPEGFQYRSFSPAGATMADGHPVPIAHDGMGVFNMPDGRFRLVRNHEDRNALAPVPRPSMATRTIAAAAAAPRRSSSTRSRASSSATSSA